MRIRSVEIQNFRCLDKVVVRFDEVTTLIGPNGAGKSSVLRALDWFFNGDKSAVLSEDDVFAGAVDDRRITVKVEFDQLTVRDRDLLGEKYAPNQVDQVAIWRTWDSGRDKITGRALAYLPFESVRDLPGAGARKTAYQGVVDENPSLNFPRWTSDAASEEMMAQWEREHPELLEEAQVSATNFFGFAGQGKLSGLFDFVLITADMRASEEAEDSKNSVIGRILEKAVDRGSANAELLTLNDEIVRRHHQIATTHFATQLDDLSNALSREVANFATGRKVTIASIEPEFRPQTTKFLVRIDDHGTKTSVDRQGHGFQRSLLLAALKLLAERGATAGDESVIFLAVEEPELFQHPAQAKSFAAVLRNLGEDPAAGVQVSYATHSPYFIEPKYFDQIRRVERDATLSSDQVVVHHASMDSVVDLLEGYLDEDAIRNRLDNSCLNELRDALFGTAVLLVEGATDRAVIEGVANKSRPLTVNGVEVAVAGSKPQLYLPQAILRQLGIPNFVLFDSDAGSSGRMRANGKSEEDIERQVLADAEANTKLLRFLGLEEQDWPSGILGTHAAAVEDTLESLVDAEWPEFATERAALIAAGRGGDQKNAATYGVAAKQADNPPAQLTSVVEAVRALAH